MSEDYKIDGEYLVDRIRKYFGEREEELVMKRFHFVEEDIRYIQLTSNLAELEHFINEFKRMIIVKKSEDKEDGSRRKT